LSPWPVSTHAIRRASPARARAARNARRRRRLAEHALLGGEEAVRRQNLLVRDGIHGATRRGHRIHRILPPRRVADPDRAGDGLGTLDHLAADERRRPRGLEAEHPWAYAEFDKAPPVRRDVARVADRDAERVEVAVEVLNELERPRLLALDAETR